MNYILQRFSDNRDCTLGLLFKEVNDGAGKRLIFQAYTLEDEYRLVKEAKETRIPAGFYELGLQPLDTPKTIQYKAKYPWFKKHIEILKVKDFKGVYIHIGNHDEDTEGCVLLGDTANNNNVATGEITTSTVAFKRFYEPVHELLESGTKVFLEIRDEKFLLK
jgi:hypothetical protein